MEMVTFCLGQRLVTLRVKSLLYSRSAKLKNKEICKVTRGFPITSNPCYFSCIDSTHFTKHLLRARLCLGTGVGSPRGTVSDPLRCMDGSASSHRKWRLLSWRTFSGGPGRGQRFCLGCSGDGRPQSEYCELQKGVDSQVVTGEGKHLGKPALLQTACGAAE